MLASRPPIPNRTPFRRRTPSLASCSASTSSPAWSAPFSCPSWTAMKLSTSLSPHISWPTALASKPGSTGAFPPQPLPPARLTPLGQPGVRASLLRIPVAPRWPCSPAGPPLALQARRLPRLPLRARARVRTLRVALLRRHLARHQSANGPLHPLLPALLAWHGTRRVRCARRRLRARPLRSFTRARPSLPAQHVRDVRTHGVPRPPPARPCRVWRASLSTRPTVSSCRRFAPHSHPAADLHAAPSRFLRRPPRLALRGCPLPHPGPGRIAASGRPSRR